LALLTATTVTPDTDRVLEQEIKSLLFVSFRRRGPCIEGQGPRRISGSAPVPAPGIRASRGVLGKKHAPHHASSRRTPSLPLRLLRAPRRAGRVDGDHAGGRLRKRTEKPAARVTGVGRGQRPLRIWAHIRPDPFPIPSTSPASPVDVTVVTYKPARRTRAGTRRGAKHQAPSTGRCPPPSPPSGPTPVSRRRSRARRVKTAEPKTFSD
jgi:hypothetical protein